ncbi:Bax inhibitor-1/YccA family protein [Vallicoccus soli]|uniref:Bax inhibitor-1/YccA family protein n=1 Tax=Vallicoccus soli TaxID=2339232 RepID=A0A3A3Z0Z9_9ACTN|nr:Bax inhibitor-1/YccA family protein [Vallicoccus soli]RJK97929.1 Bax inhibitor-1/YccA family protein [Vallicoccus soli]
MARQSGFGHSNPAFDRNPAFSGHSSYAAAAPAMSAADLQSMYDAPSAGPVQTQRMTLDDVVVKCAIVFGALFVAAGVTFFVLPESTAAGLALPGLLVGLVLGLVISFKQSTNPALILSYAVAEGLFLGAISRFFDAAYDGIVAQAVLGTLAAAGAMLFVFSTGRLRATPKFTKVLLTAGLAYVGIALVNLVLRLTGVLDGWGFYGAGPLGLLLCAAGVALASFFLILDFDFIQRGIQNGAPARYSWFAAAGLLMTLVWLYVEMLRLLAILRGDE